MYIKQIAEVLLAFFAVFGLYALIRLFVTSRLLPRAVSVAVEIRAGTELSALPLLLRSAADCAFFGSRRLIALVDRSLAGEDTLLRVLGERGVRVYFVEFEKQD